jgi:hypothetical protein
MPDRLQQLVDRIPVAERGAPITVDLHNTMREALMLLATAGIGAATGPRTLSLVPAFQTFGGGPNWVHLNGFASIPGPVAEGWIPVHLPDGAVIDSMIVKGRKAGAVGVFQVRLRYTALDPNETSRAIIRIDDLASVTDDPFTVSGQVSIQGLSGAALMDARTVKNDSRIYFVTAVVEEAGHDNDVAEVHSIQVSYVLGPS